MEKKTNIVVLPLTKIKLKNARSKQEMQLKHTLTWDEYFLKLIE